MSIEVLVDAIHQRCDGCAATRTLDFEQLEVGVVPDAAGTLGTSGQDRTMPVVGLPSCDVCGAVEFVRAPAVAADRVDDTLTRLWSRMRLPAAVTRPVADVVDDVSPARDQESP
jgi:hypothetical protein